jgi:hypothetical protein
MLFLLELATVLVAAVDWLPETAPELLDGYPPKISGKPP